MTGQIHATLFAVAMHVLSTNALSAQDMTGLPVAPGSRIRVMSTVDVNVISGRLSRINDGALTLMTSSGLRSVPSAKIDRMDRSLGDHRLRNTIAGAMVGTLIGATLGARIAAREGVRRECEMIGQSRHGCSYELVPVEKLIAATAIGLVGGGIIGTFTGHERWETVFRGKLAAEPAR